MGQVPLSCLPSQPIVWQDRHPLLYAQHQAEIKEKQQKYWRALRGTWAGSPWGPHFLVFLAVEGGLPFLLAEVIGAPDLTNNSTRVRSPKSW